jgi:5-methylcytosine-specific restriction endonuclease McrA
MMSTNSANGSTRRWRALRAAFLARHPFCSFCDKRATEVDHVRTLASGGARFDPNNLRALCSDCHKVRHDKRPRSGVDPATGYPLSHHWWCDASGK